MALPESDDYDTLAGLVLARLGRMPEPGDQVVVPTRHDTDPFAEDEPDDGNLAELTVLSLSRRVPEWVRIAPLKHAHQHAEAAR